ncbi:MAG TPA: VWA domain-containing protein, partial [Opitutaceae bacterium]
MNLWDNYRLLNPEWFLALALIALVSWARNRRRLPVLLVPFAASWYRPSLGSISRWPQILAALGLIAIIVALARPQKVEDKREVRSSGYDLMLAIDLSGSMLSEDYERNGEAINRIQAIKPVVQAFINNRPNDRIGIVVFSGRAYTLAPLTFDHDWLARQTDRLHVGIIEDGTAIGDGLGIALSRLEQAKHETAGQRKGAFVVLLTDGANNRGALQPMQAAAIAKSRGIPIYTIGAGRDGYVPVPQFDEQGHRIGTVRALSDLDEGALRDIADTTGGRYFKADDVRTVENAFKAIDRAQKIDFQAKSYLISTELFAWPAGIGLGLLAFACACEVVRGASRHKSKSIAARAPGTAAIVSTESARSI